MMTAGCWACADRAMREGDVCEHCGAMADAHGVRWHDVRWVPDESDKERPSAGCRRCLDAKLRGNEACSGCGAATGAYDDPDEGDAPSLAEMLAEARREERAAIVAYLRATSEAREESAAACEEVSEVAYGYSCAADDIERGLHEAKP